jgi:glycosyltransferase involved in cell wall biosynthesis
VKQAPASASVARASRPCPHRRDAGATAARLLHLVSTFQTKTDTKWLVQLARHLDRSAFELHAACFYDDGPVRGQLESLGVRTYNLSLPCEWDLRAVWRVRQLIRSLRADLVHTHLLRADLYGGAAARWAGVPAVSTVYAIGAFARARRRLSDPLLDAASAALPTHVIAVSEAVRRDCIERLRMNPRRVTVIHTGIEPPARIEPGEAEHCRAEWNVSVDAPLVLTLARLSYEKGVDTLIDAATILHEGRPQARFVVLGDGPDRSELQRRIDERRATSVVMLAGFRQDVWPALAASDIVCLPSKSEGMPNVLLEAMAMGRPVVATAVGGIPEAVIDGQTGLLVAPADPRGLADALRRLIDDRELARRLGEAGRATVERRFLAHDVAACYGELYRTLLVDSAEGSKPGACCRASEVPPFSGTACGTGFVAGEGPK